MRITIPTLLTLARIILTPFIVVALLRGQWTLGLALFVVAALTDLLDGFIARRFNQQSTLGALLDPLADKFLMITVLAALSLSDHSLPTIVSLRWFFVLLLSKELLLITGIGLLGSFKKNVTIEPTGLGKIAMILQVSAVGLVWLFSLCDIQAVRSVTILLYTAAFFVMASLVQYMLIGLRVIRRGS
jgi:cardiolipin synthase